MKTIKDGVKLDEIGITIYSPDTYYSNLTKEIDCFIINKTRLVPQYREIITHDSSSIEKFYKYIVSNNPNWPLVVELFTSGPSLLTVWSGNNTINKLIDIKGKSHPKLAKNNTIRANFWCDNKVCNLVHSSDNVNEMHRELESIQKKEVLDLPFLEYHKECDNYEKVHSFINNQNSTITHNGMFIFANCITKLLENSNGIILNTPNLPEDGNAISTYEVLMKYFNLIKLYNKEKISMIIDMFLAGDINSIKLLESSIKLSRWEEFIIKCSVKSMNTWN